jgi:ABC-2 type transport system permease protein
MDMMIPAYVAMAIAVNGLMTLPLNLSEYVTNKVYKRFDATPMGKGNVVIVQVLVYFLAALVSAATVVILGWWLYRINILGAWYVIAFAMLLSCAAIFSIGFFIAAVFKNAKNAQVASYIVYFVMLFLSGTTLPLQIMPHNIRTVANFLPLTHAVSLLQEAFDGQPLGEQWVAMVVLTGVLIFCGGVGGVMYRKRKWA